MITDMTTPTTNAAELDLGQEGLSLGEVERALRLHRVSYAVIKRRVEVDPTIPSMDPLEREKIARREGIAWQARNELVLENYVKGEIWNGIGLPSFVMTFEGASETWWDLPTGNPDGQTIREQVIAFLEPANWEVLP